MKKTNALIAAVLVTSMLTACGGTDTAEMTSAESTVSETTAATVSETDTLSAESEETTTETAVEDLKTDKSDGLAEDEVDIEPIEDETFWDMTTETEETFPALPIPPEVAKELEYGGRSNVFLMGDYMSDFEDKMWMTIKNTYVSTDDCELLFFENKEDAATEQIAYVGTTAAGDHTVLGLYRKYDDSFADDPMVGESYWDYKNHILAVSSDDVLQYFPADTAIPSTIVLFPDCGEFYYYGAATEEEYENYEWHWTKSTDLGLTWKPDSDSSTVGNFYYGSDPVVYTGVWSCGNTEIWID